jgi:ribonuclease HII
LINEYSDFSAHTLISHRIIDRINVNNATEYAIKKLIKKIPIKPDIILLDGNFRFNLGIPVISIIKGDSLSISIASASILAKVKRDIMIEKYDLIYPGYSFKKNKGYGTSEHINAIKNTGISPIHRKTYEPVASMIDDSLKLF